MQGKRIVVNGLELKTPRSRTLTGGPRNGSTPTTTWGVYNIGSDRPVSILELAQRVIAAVEKKGLGDGGRGAGKKAEGGGHGAEPRIPNIQSPIPNS